MGWTILRSWTTSIIYVINCQTDKEINMFTKHKVYYTVEVKSDDQYIFICSFSTFDEANDKVESLREQTSAEYRILKIEKDVEEVS